MSISGRSRSNSNVSDGASDGSSDGSVKLSPLPLTPVPSNVTPAKNDRVLDYLKSSNNSSSSGSASVDDEEQGNNQQQNNNQAQNNDQEQNNNQAQNNDQEQSDAQQSSNQPTPAEEKCYREAQAIFSNGNLVEITKIINSAEFTPNVLLIRNEDGRTLLHHLFVFATVRNIQIIKALIESKKCTDEVLKSVSENNKDNKSSPLHLALRADIPEDVFELMVSQKTCTDEVLETRDKDGNTVLHLTAMQKKQSCFRSILRSPSLTEALLLCQNNQFNTALHCIVTLSDFDALKDILATGACSAKVLRVFNDKKQTCLYQAADLEKISAGMTQREFELKRTMMVKRLLKYNECTQNAFGYFQPAKDKNKPRVIRGTEAVKKLKKLNTTDEIRRETLNTTDEIRRDIALYFLQTELNELDGETLNENPAVREAIKKFIFIMRSVKQEDVNTSELIDMVFYTRRTRAFVSNPKGDYDGYTNELMRIRKIDRSWAKIAAQVGLVVLFACLTAAAISISLASFGIGGAFVAAAFGIVIAKQITIGTGLAIAASVTGLGLTGTSAFFAGKNIRQSEMSRAGENIRDKVAETVANAQGARLA